MKWLIDEQSAAINEVLVLIKKSIHFCEHAVNRLGDGRTRRFFLQEFREFNVFLSGLIDFIRIKGELPREPDSDKEALEQWGADIRALLSESEEISFLEHYRDLQHDLYAATESARKSNGGMPESIRSVLENLDRHVSRTLRGRVEKV